jgi:pSer/pThr/pTyr-binding forkhead associated (FHA) protein
MQSSASSPSITLSLPQAFALACKATRPLALHAAHRVTGALHEFSISSPFVFIGRSAAAGVRLDDPSVSQCHAYLQVVEGVPFCIDLGSRSGVIWDDGTQGQGWVNPDHTLRLGAFDLRIESPSEPSLALADDAPHDSDPDAGPTLTPAAVEIHPATNAGNQSYPLDRPIALVGRHPNCDLRLLDDSIAYFQCALVNTADGVWFVDTMTRKGAILNGRGTRLARVRDGDLLEFGKKSLLFRIGSHHGHRLALRPQETPAPTSGHDAVTAISTAVSESLAVAFAPVGEIMKQFQQCYMAMAQTFVSMQQEHAMLVGEQMRQIRELASELRELRNEVRRDGVSPAPTHPHSPPTEAPAPKGDSAPMPQPAVTPRAPSLKPPAGAEGQVLSDAHAWFMDRLANKSGQNPPAAS